MHVVQEEERLRALCRVVTYPQPVCIGAEPPPSCHVRKRTASTRLQRRQRATAHLTRTTTFASQAAMKSLRLLALLAAAVLAVALRPAAAAVPCTKPKGYSGAMVLPKVCATLPPPRLERSIAARRVAEVQ